MTFAGAIAGSVVQPRVTPIPFLPSQLTSLVLDFDHHKEVWIDEWWSTDRPKYYTYPLYGWRFSHSPSHRSPLYQRNILNGYNVTSWDGDFSGWFKALGGTQDGPEVYRDWWGWITNPGYTVAMVVRPSAQASLSTIHHLGYRGYSSAGKYSEIAFGGVNAAEKYPSFRFGDGYQVFTRAQLSDAWHVVIMSRPLGGTYNDGRCWVDGIEWTETTVDNPTGVPDVLPAVEDPDSYFSMLWGADIKEWDNHTFYKGLWARQLLFNTLLTTEQVTQVSRYLARLYGL